MQLLTDAIIKALPTPKRWLATYRDSRVRGLGVRVTKHGVKAFVLDYSSAGRRRVYTIGKVRAPGDTGGWTLAAARERALDLQAQIRSGDSNPADQLKQAREAETVEELCQDYIQHELPKLRASTRRDYERMIKNDILPKIGKMKVAAVKTDDIRKLHRTITGRGSPVAANGCVVLCRRLFNIAKVADNPAKGVERNPTSGRERYLKEDEIGRLSDALDKYSDQNVADILRLLMFTGARRGEVQSATWDQFELKGASAAWTKPSSHTKQKKVHRVPLSPPAVAILTKRRADADAELKKLGKSGDPERIRRVETFVFPAENGERGHVAEIKKAWASLCKTAKIKGARIHDLRHTAASVLASGGVSLIMIGKLLGHTQASTTARYSHLFEQAQQATANLLGAAISKAAKKR